MTDERKRKKKHLKPSVVGSKHTVHFDRDWIEITIRIPRRILTERLVGRKGRYLPRYGDQWLRHYLCVKSLTEKSGRVANISGASITRVVLKR